jgi:BirA family biotin operon repressor/biotin-[acetyl-CoA-carboxylase] ligase
MAKDILSAEAITQGLETRVIGRRVLYYPSVTSTNEVAKQQARQGADEGTVVIADEQTMGKGRLKRLWLTPGGNIALSIILRPEIAALPSMIMLASLAVLRGIESATGLKAGIKWPNDVLIGGRKVCGILIENDLRGSILNYTVIGIGINTGLRTEDFPEIRATATSLDAELGREVSRLSVVRRLLAEMDRLYLSLPDNDAVYEEWRANLVTLGKAVHVTAGETVYEGVAESVSRDGSLLLRGPDGSLTPVVAGDVTLR